MTSRTNGVIGFYIHLKKTERPCYLRKQKVTEFLIESYRISYRKLPDFNKKVTELPFFTPKTSV